jgi:hypothetical protein
MICDNSGKEVWKRNFYIMKENKKIILSSFNTTQSLYEEQLKENLKNFNKLFFLFNVKIINENRFDLICSRVGINIIKKYNLYLPKFLTPEVVGITKTNDKGWFFEVRISPPKIFKNILGESILSYSGENYLK